MYVCVQGCLYKLKEDITKTLEKVGSREKYLNTQLEHLISEYRQAQAQLNKVNTTSTTQQGVTNQNTNHIWTNGFLNSVFVVQVKELYQQASGGVTERTRILAEVSLKTTIPQESCDIA